MKEADANDIDSLVEEELSRGRSEECSVEDEAEDGKGASADRIGMLGTSNGTNGARLNGSKGSQQSDARNGGNY